MTTVWRYSPALEARRLLHTAHLIASGFYRLNGFLVLPYASVPPGPENLVLFPDLPYLSIPRFWDRTGKINIKTCPSIEMDIAEDLADQTQSLLSTIHLPQPDYQPLKSTWDKHQPEIMEAIYQTIPSLARSVSKVSIWLTNFGTNCSFNLCSPKNRTHHIYIWLQPHTGLSSIVEAILTSLTRQAVYNQLSGLWSESEIIVDWLLTFSPIAQVLNRLNTPPDPALTIRGTRTLQKASQVEASRLFLQKLGAPAASPVKVDTSQFTPREKQLFQLLLDRSPCLVTVDEIADLLFSQNPDQFSLYAISKSIQRLRDRLEACGVSGSFIQTKRGEGYLLAN